jgi:hypothetical protein
MRIEGQVNVGIVRGVYWDESGRTKQWVDERYEKWIKDSRKWLMNDTRQRKEFFGGLAEGDWFEVQSGKKRVALQSG